MATTISEPLRRSADSRAVRPHVARRSILSRRTSRLVLVAVAAATFVGAVAAVVKVMAPQLAPEKAADHWPAAVLAALAVAAVGAAAVALAARRRRASAAGSALSPTASAAPGAGRFSLPTPLRWQRIPRRAVLAGGVVSGSFALAAALAGYQLWVIALAALLPWIPAVLFETAWKVKQYGLLFAFFLAVVLFQVGHMGEHTVQVLQLIVTNGALASSHGVFGRLDFELVHFLSDTGVWLSLGLLLALSRSGSRWLWVAFVVASFHEVEHVYLFWVYLADHAFYTQGGYAGILASGGVIGSPLARPYLHFTYNLVVVVPMVLALWDRARLGDALPGEPASHHGRAGLLRPSTTSPA